MEPSDPLSSVQPRVMHLDDGQLWRGGQHQVYLLLTELARRGIPQRLLARPGSPLARRARDAGIDVEPIPYHGELDIFAASRIATLAENFGANLLHAHTAHAHAIGLGAARRLRGQAVLVTTRRVDFAIKRGFFSRRKYLTAGQRYIAISDGVRRVLIDGGVPATWIDVVPSGVPPIDPAEAWPRERVREQLDIAPDELAIVNIGALTDHKGQRWLIEAAPTILAAEPRARIHILGEGELRDTLASQIQSLGLAGKVILHGYLENARLMQAGFDLFVSSSHLEGLGTVILDAMLAGLPVVAAAAGGIPEIVRDGQTGRLVPARDAKALAAAVVEALRQPEATRALAAAGRELVETHFSARSMARGTLGVYEKILAAQPVAGRPALALGQKD